MAKTAPSPQSQRRLNAESLLAVLRPAGVVTVSDLMAATGLTRSTVLSICAELIEFGWVEELETQRTTPEYVKGRPARRFRFVRAVGSVLGIDLGAQKTTVVVADLLGEIRAKVTRPFRTVDIPAAERVDAVDQTAREALDAADVSARSVLAVSVGLAAPVGRDGVVLATSEYWQLFDIDLATALADRHGWHVRLENDANLAALAERWCGDAGGVDDLVVMLAGERLGAGVLESGRLLHGARGGFGELAFLDLIEGALGPRGVAAIARMWAIEALSAGSEPSALRQLCDGSVDALTAQMIFDAAADGDPVAFGVTQRVATWMARIIGSVSTILNPELVVIGGAVAESADVILPEIRTRLPEFTATPAAVVASGLGDAIVSVGAVRHALDYVDDHALELRPSRLVSSSGRQNDRSC